MTWCVAEWRILEYRDEVLDFLGSCLYPYIADCQLCSCVCAGYIQGMKYVDGTKEGGKQNKILTCKKKSVRIKPLDNICLATLHI